MTRYVLSCVTDGGNDSVFYVLNSVVFASRDGCNNNRRDSDVSLSDTIWWPHDYVRFFHSILLHAHCSSSQRSVPDSSGQQRSNRFLSNNKDTSIVHIPSNRLEVTVHKAYDEYPMSQTNHYGSYPSSDTQLPNKSHELGSDENVEGGEGKS
jgi:hypothetical protein